MANVCVSCPAPSRRRAPAYRRAPARRSRRRAPVRRRRTTRRASRGMLPSFRRNPKLTKFELAQLNPFDKRVLGVKIPDSNTQPSDTFRSEDRYAVTTAVTDLAICTAYMPNLFANQVAATNSTSTAWTWPISYGGVTNSAVRTDAQNSFVGLRPCGHGVRISSPLAPTSVTGFVHIGIYPVNTYGNASWALPINLSQLSNLPWYRRFTLAQLTQKSVTIVNKFIDITATRYSSPGADLVESSTDGMFQFAGGWCAIVIAIEGAPIGGGTALSAENLVHFEAMPLNSSANTGSFSPAAPYDTQEMEGVSRLGGATTGVFVEGEEDSVIQNGLNALSRGAAAAAGEIYENAVLPAARGFGYAATYAAYGAARRYAGGYSGGIPGINTPRLMN